ncbi:MAG TPA: hypothetical protein PLZ79_07805 [Burkholderiales bacterium]|nr:hypothetical protein [Burkholderiaceae bacterium]HQR53161.1 hypothetical protein [Burkholderiales bacterium]
MNQNAPKEPARVAAAIRIVEAARDAISRKMEESGDSRWDAEVLLYEFTRVLGRLLRLEDVPPSEFDEVLMFLRRVYSGAVATYFMGVEEAVQRFCPAQQPDADGTADPNAVPPVVH